MQVCTQWNPGTRALRNKEKTSNKTWEESCHSCMRERGGTLFQNESGNSKLGRQVYNGSENKVKEMVLNDV